MRLMYVTRRPAGQAPTQHYDSRMGAVGTAQGPVRYPVGAARERALLRSQEPRRPDLDAGAGHHGHGYGHGPRHLVLPHGGAAGLPGPGLALLMTSDASPPRYRDVAAFDERAAGYDQGWLGRLHHDIADQTAEIALTASATPERVLDVGCGSGYLLRLLASRCPGVVELAGVDAAPGMIKVAAASALLIPGDERLRFSVGVAEHLPFRDGSFDLVVSVTSFDHWSDQQAGLAECHRVLVPGGHLVLVDQFSGWLVPTLVFSRSGKARTKRRVNTLLDAAGFGPVAWHRVYAVIINAAVATA